VSTLHRSLVGLAIASLCVGYVLVGGERASANADCLQSDPVADVLLTETLTTTAAGHDLHVVATNLGPCNVPDAVLTISLPSGSTVFSVSSNPSSWNCGTAGALITCPASGGAPTIGVPGNHDFIVSFALAATPPSDLTIISSIAVGGGESACTDGSSTTTCDPYTDNNTIWGAAIPTGTGGSLTTCANPPCTQYTDVTVGTGGTSGSVQIQQLQSDCPPAFPNCFGKRITITSAITGALWTKIFTINASLSHGSYGAVHLINSTNGSAWSIVQTCSRNDPTYPCVLSKSKFKGPDGTTHITFVVQATDDDSWGFDD